MCVKAILVHFTELICPAVRLGCGNITSFVVLSIRYVLTQQSCYSCCSIFYVIIYFFWGGGRGDSSAVSELHAGCFMRPRYATLCVTSLMFVFMTVDLPKRVGYVTKKAWRLLFLYRFSDSKLRRRQETRKGSWSSSERKTERQVLSCPFLLCKRGNKDLSRPNFIFSLCPTNDSFTCFKS